MENKNFEDPNVAPEDIIVSPEDQLNPDNNNDPEFKKQKEFNSVIEDINNFLNNVEKIKNDKEKKKGLLSRLGMGKSKTTEEEKLLNANLWMTYKKLNNFQSENPDFTMEDSEKKLIEEFISEAKSSAEKNVESIENAIAGAEENNKNQIEGLEPEKRKLFGNVKNSIKDLFKENSDSKQEKIGYAVIGLAALVAFALAPKDAAITQFIDYINNIGLVELYSPRSILNSDNGLLLHSDRAPLYNALMGAGAFYLLQRSGIGGFIKEGISYFRNKINPTDPEVINPTNPTDPEVINPTNPTDPEVINPTNPTDPEVINPIDPKEEEWSEEDEMFERYDGRGEKKQEDRELTEEEKKQHAIKDAFYKGETVNVFYDGDVCKVVEINKNEKGEVELKLERVLESGSIGTIVNVSLDKLQLEPGESNEKKETSGEFNFIKGDPEEVEKSFNIEKMLEADGLVFKEGDSVFGFTRHDSEIIDGGWKFIGSVDDVVFISKEEGSDGIVQKISKKKFLEINSGDKFEQIEPDEEEKIVNFIKQEFSKGEKIEVKYKGKYGWYVDEIKQEEGEKPKLSLKKLQGSDAVHTNVDLSKIELKLSDYRKI